ncbi:MAG: GNAT family N-acetyltransferase [Desulfobacteraceae bacterium]|nr:GNAT family N-acetyltransferase [Desulfobacteraceae bacterium]
MNYEIDDNVFGEFPVLETKRLLLRKFTMSDAPDFFEMRSDENIMKYLARPYQKSVSEAEKMIENSIKSFKEKAGINWVIEEKSLKKFVGYIGFWQLMRESIRAEIGYALKPAFWGKGIMPEAISKVVQFGFDELSLHGIEANINPGNAGSIRALEKMGFKKEAHFRENFLYDGKYLDSVIYCLLETDRCGNQCLSF